MEKDERKAASDEVDGASDGDWHDIRANSYHSNRKQNDRLFCLALAEKGTVEMNRWKFPKLTFNEACEDKDDPVAFASSKFASPCCPVMAFCCLVLRF
ncbi:MAG: hypothetical protein R3D55_01260 [Chloroflexota bacterium]